MAFNEQGEWVDLNPYEEYQQKVIKSKEQPGQGGMIWTAELRNRLHDAATRFIMIREGIEDTQENFFVTRERISREIEEAYDCDERNGFLKPSIYNPQEDISSSPFYKHNGD